MKKLWSLAFATILCFTLAACADNKPSDANSNQNKSVPSGNAATSGNAAVRKDYFEWSPTDDTVIVGYTEEGRKQEELVIPEKCTSVQGLKDNNAVKRVTFENADTKISSMAFSNCTNLQSVDLPGNLKEIEHYTFYQCQSLKSISIPEGVASIGHDAFSGCSSLESVSFGNQIQSIDRSAFYSCTSLKSVSLPDSVTAIGKSSFEGCSSLTDLSFGAKVQTIEESAFQACIGLKSVKLPEGVTKLGLWAFAYCDALEEIYMPSSLESVEVSSIAQTHKIKVYVVEGSYMDQRLDSLMSVKFYDKQYQ